MICIYERSLCQSYMSAYRQGILLAKTDCMRVREEARHRPWRQRQRQASRLRELRMGER